MIDLITPPSYQALYAWCIDDSLPGFAPEAWVEKGRVYVVKHLSEPLNLSEGYALTLLDKQGREIHPSGSHWSFASHRFEMFSVYLN